MTNQAELLKQVRVVGRGTRGAAPSILELPDADLYEVFQQGTSNNWLIFRCIV